MIRCLLLMVTRHRHGEPVHEDRVISGETLRIGRGTDCTVHLADPRVKYLHATIRMNYEGRLRIEGNGKVLKGEDGFVQDVELNAGSSVMLGPYRLVVEPTQPDYDLVLSVELVQALPDERRELQARSRTSLTARFLSRRVLALGLGALVLGLFLALPVLYLQRADVRAEAAQLPLAPDESWNPGPLSDAHRAFARNCGECHQKPFVRVQDSACRNCHVDVDDHIVDKGLQATTFGATRCAQCHLEHKGNDGLSHGDSRLCSDCHGDIKARVAGTRLPPVHDFLTRHPGFKLTLPRGNGQPGFQRVAQTDPGLAENSGLKFPHDLHLAEDGIASPGGRMLLKCRSCHDLDEAGLRFKPMVMEQACASCHRLAFEPAVSDREVPHGAPREVLTVLREFYAGISVGERAIEVTTVDGLLQRPGSGTGDRVRREAGAWAQAKAMTVARDLFEVRVCVSCHEVSRQHGDPDSPWRIAPVTLNTHWLPKAGFDHGKHRNVGCVGCHDVPGSSRSEDVNIPDINLCRDCHVGAEPVRNMITSDCGSCHGFHAGPERLLADEGNTAEPDPQASPAAPEKGQAVKQEESGR